MTNSNFPIKLLIRHIMMTTTTVVVVNLLHLLHGLIKYNLVTLKNINTNAIQKSACVSSSSSSSYLSFFILSTSLVAKIFGFQQKNIMSDDGDDNTWWSQKKQYSFKIWNEHYDHDHKMILSCTIADNDEDKSMHSLK